MLRMVRHLSAIAAFALSAGVAAAQTFPTKVVTLIVPFAAGGPTDAIARLLAQSMSSSLKQQVIVENVAGAGGTTGAARLAKARPDGYTLLLHHVALAAGASLYKNLSYDTVKDIEPLGLVNFGPMVLTAKKDYPPRDAKELIAKLKTDGAKVTMAHAGIGSNSHLCGLLIQEALGIKVTEVAYRGTGPAMNDLMGGQVDVLCDQTTNAVPQIQGNTIKAYAVTSPNRLSVLPDLPTLIEAGVPNFEFVIWHGLYAPKGTPADVVATLNGALQSALAEKMIQERFGAVGTEIFGPAERSPEPHRARFGREVEQWKIVIGKAGVSN